MNDNSFENLKTLQDIHPITAFELTYTHFNILFSLSHDELDNMLESEFPYDEPRVVDKRTTAVRMVSKLYLKYIQVTNKFIKCHEYLSNPQKRRYLRKLCDGCIGRTLELKHELVSLEMSDFHFLDQTLLELRMFPQDMDIKIPEYFKDDIPNEELRRKKFVEQSLKAKQEAIINQNAVTKEEKLVRMATVLIKMIQGHERTRQARKYFCEAQKTHLRKKLDSQREIRRNAHFGISRFEAALIIQRAWRMYHSRKALESEYLAEMKRLKMLPSEDRKNNIINDIEKYRLDIIKRDEDEYLREREKVKQDMLIYSVPRMAEKLEERIRNYVHEYEERNGKFPVFPSEEEGGSIAMLTVNPESENEPTEEPQVGTKKKTNESKSTKSNKVSKKTDSKEIEPAGYAIRPSKYIPIILDLMGEYRRNWAGKKLSNLDKFDIELMMKDVETEVELEVRLRVDEKIKGELLQLSDAPQRDSKKKAKKSKKGKHNGKKEKRKHEKDLTSDRTLESLVEELVDQGIIVNYPRHSLKDFLGEYNWSGSVQRLSEDEDNEPLPCLADIRRIVNEYCILPMGSEAVHYGGAYIKSILLAGPRGSGKNLLVQSISSEIGATMMNLSAENIEGKYPGEEGLERLLHLISKVGRLLQPTVIYIKDAENYFWKKKPATCTLSQTGRLKKELPKLIKKFKNTDRILVCGTTVLPFDVDPKRLSDCYSKIICIFKPDYNCRSCLWKKFITKAGGDVTKKLNLSVLSNVSDGFVASHIQSTVLQVLSHRRLVSTKIPLHASDFIFALAEHVPVYEEEHKEYQKWLKKLPLGMKRDALFEQETEDLYEEEASEEDDYFIQKSI